MNAAVVSLLIMLLSAVVAVGLLIFAIRRTRREPRRLSNGFWLLAGGLLTLDLAASLGVPSAGAVQGLLGLVIIAGPLLIDVVAVFLVINGITMLRKESRSLANMLSLLAGLGLLALSVAPLIVFATGAGWLLVPLLFLALGAAYLGFVFVGFLLYGWLYPRLVARRPAAWVAVLGSGLVDGHRVPPLLAGRIAAGQAEASRRGARLLIMSGGQGADERLPEAEAMAAWARDHGTDPDTLLVEDRSRTTEENLRFTAELLASRTDRGLSAGPQGIVGHRTLPGWLDRILGGPIMPAPDEGLLVTSDYHVLRAAILARWLGLPAQAAGARTARYYWPSAVLREFVALVVDRWRLHLVLGLLVALPLPLIMLTVLR